MTTPQNRVQNDVKTAMKAGDKERLSTLRLLLGELKNEKIRLGTEVDESRFLEIVQKAIKQRHEAATQFRKGGRDEMAAREEREVITLTAYLPEPASEEELRAAIEALVAERSLSGPRGLGPVMQEIRPRFAGRADGGTIQRIARDVLGA